MPEGEQSFAEKKSPPGMEPGGRGKGLNYFICRGVISPFMAETMRPAGTRREKQISGSRPGYAGGTVGAAGPASTSVTACKSASA